MRGYYNTYSGLGSSFVDMLKKAAQAARANAQAQLDAQQTAQAIVNAQNNQNPNPATTYTDKNIYTRVGYMPILPQTTTPQATTPTTTTPTTTTPTTTTTTPTTTTPTQSKPAKTWKDYLVWIALGGVVAFGAYKMLAGGKKKRR